MLVEANLGGEGEQQMYVHSWLEGISVLSCRLKVYGLMNSSETMISAFTLLALVLYVFGVLGLKAGLLSCVHTAAYTCMCRSTCLDLSCSSRVLLGRCALGPRDSKCPTEAGFPAGRTRLSAVNNRWSARLLWLVRLLKADQTQVHRAS